MVHAYSPCTQEAEEEVWVQEQPGPHRAALREAQAAQQDLILKQTYVKWNKQKKIQNWWYTDFLLRYPYDIKWYSVLIHNHVAFKSFFKET